MQHGDARLARRSMRLPGHDYGLPGWYFVTICAHDRLPLFGDVGSDLDGRPAVCLNASGKIVEAEWLTTPLVRPQARLDAYVVMPNHVHGIVIIDGAWEDVRPAVDSMTAANQSRYSQTLGSMVRGFKAPTSRRLNDLRGTPGAPIWQRSLYDRIIRDVPDLDRVRAYIEDNPRAWAEDEYHVSRRPE